MLLSLTSDRVFDLVQKSVKRLNGESKEAFALYTSKQIQLKSLKLLSLEQPLLQATTMGTPLFLISNKEFSTFWKHKSKTVVFIPIGSTPIPSTANEFSSVYASVAEDPAPLLAKIKSLEKRLRETKVSFHKRLKDMEDKHKSELIKLQTEQSIPKPAVKTKHNYAQTVYKN